MILSGELLTTNYAINKDWLRQEILMKNIADNNLAVWVVSMRRANRTLTAVNLDKPELGKIVAGRRPWRTPAEK